MCGVRDWPHAGLSSSFTHSRKDDDMTRHAIPLKEFDAEMKSTRRLVERVPSDKAQWKPHEKSFALGHLTQLVCWMPGWIAQTLNKPVMDIQGGGEGGGYSFQPTEKLVATFDENVEQARDALSRVTDDALDEMWSLNIGPQVIMSMPKGEAARQHLNHFCHHRGQLTVYCRLIDVPLPQIYGPTADEKWGS
jgi:uncharacterized damage-inducible protein DinB